MIPSVESYLYIKYLWENGQDMTGFPNGWAEAFVGYCFDHKMVQPSFEIWTKEITKWKTGCWFCGRLARFGLPCLQWGSPLLFLKSERETMKTLIGVYHNSFGEEYIVIVDLNEGDTIQTAFETAIEELKHITADNVNSSDVSWFSAERLKVNKTVTYTLE